MLYDLDFESFRAYFASLNTNSREILQALTYVNRDELCETQRSCTFLESWILTSSSEVLIKFLQCIFDQMGITHGLELKVVQSYSIHSDF